MQHKKKRNRKSNSNRNNFKQVEARTENQKDYIRAIVENDVIICVGPAGAGKSFVAAGISAQHIVQKRVEQIIVTRPLVCAGKDIGALPGDVGEKIKPYLTPMEESLRYFLGQSHYGLYANERRIRFEPLEVMRGATFHNSYMILDEAQNCTLEQIKMFITRMGEDSKVIINGDIKQTDIRGLSGLQTCIERLKCVDSVATIELTNEDIQRNSIIGEILDALED
jgi:phosphate starvation-inducible PhoH-like protein